MSNYKYKISVVIPIYNCENFIESCFKSLAAQSMNCSDFQIVFVNDGSKDGSAECCRKLAEQKENIVYHEKENGGVSSARNIGIRLAEGKYIMFLDADDTLSPGSLEAIYDFFEKHSNDVDLVTYSIDYLNEKGAVTTHKRFNYLNCSGVYDINSDYNILQTTMNVCVKNVSENERIYFDESLSLGEDQWFIFSWLLKKQKIGFVKEAVYTYYRHSGSASSVFNNPYYCFDQYTEFLQKLLDSKRDENGKAHKTAQALVVYNLGWRITSDLLVSHVDEKTERAQLEKLENIVKEIDNEIICNSIYIDPFHVEYFMRLKKEKFSVALNNSAISAFSGNVLWFSQTHAIVFNTLRVHNDKLYVSGYLKNGVENYENIGLFYTNSLGERHDVEMQKTTFSYYKSKAPTNLFGGFDLVLDIADSECITFHIEIDNVKAIPNVYFGFKCAVNRSKSQVSSGGRLLVFDEKSKGIIIKKAQTDELKAAEAAADKSVLGESKGAFVYRKLAKKCKNQSEIWLYCDREGIFDNAYEQFIHDFSINDGVKRYYVVDRLKNKSKYFNSKQRKNLVDFQSLKHKLLFLNCKKIFTSFNSLTVFSPFGGLPLKWYSDITDFEVIYLQHGILHANLPLLYSKEKANVDKVVVSSEFERKNFKNIYGFKDEDLILSGMPRFDIIDLSKKPQRKILFSPSWRKNLIGDYENNTRVLFTDKFLESPFYNQVNDFLNSKELAALLEKYDLTLDFKNHPIFRDYDYLFKVDNPRIRVTQETGDMQDYAAMITDYSSIVFDFVYLERPIIYFVPDYEQFKAGITHSYYKLDLPLEEGFGDIAENGTDLLNALAYLAENQFKPKEIYSERMHSFFASREKNHASMLYRAVTGK